MDVQRLIEAQVPDGPVATTPSTLFPSCYQLPNLMEDLFRSVQRDPTVWREKSADVLSVGFMRAGQTAEKIQFGRTVKSIYLS